MQIKNINGLRFIKLPVLENSGCLHAFGTRDPGKRGIQAHSRIKGAFPEIDEIAVVHQVHGKKAVRVKSKDDTRNLSRANADIIIVSKKGIAAAVRTADCVPILIHDPKRKVAAAVHSGWKGTIKRAGEEAVRVLEREYKSKASDLVAGIGPCIGPCHYQVDAPVIEGIEEALGDKAGEVLRPDAPGKAMLDLSSANRIILEEAGILPDRIEEVRACTFCDSDLFYSYRREGKGTSSLYHFIALRQDNIIN